MNDLLEILTISLLFGSIIIFILIHLIIIAIEEIKDIYKYFWKRE